LSRLSGKEKGGKEKKKGIKDCEWRAVAPGLKLLRLPRTRSPGTGEGGDWWSWPMGVKAKGIPRVCNYRAVPAHRNWQIETAVWNLAGFLHCALETRWQRSGQFLNYFLNDFVNDFLCENLNFLCENLRFPL